MNPHWHVKSVLKGLRWCLWLRLAWSLSWCSCLFSSKAHKPSVPQLFTSFWYIFPAFKINVTLFDVILHFIHAMQEGTACRVFAIPKLAMMIPGLKNSFGQAIHLKFQLYCIFAKYCCSLHYHLIENQKSKEDNT